MSSLELAIATAIARDNLPERECRKCGELKGPGEFARDASKRDGLSTRCKACAAAHQALYHAANTDKERERKARYYAENVEKVRERRARYYAENPEVFRAADRRRRARKALVPHIPYDAERLYSEPCYLCGESADAVEHVYPLARWWDPRTADAAYNVLPVCTSCNSGKRDRDPIEHWNSLGFRPFDRVVFADLCEWVGDPDYVTVYRVE